LKQQVEALGDVREQYGGRLISASVTFGRYDLLFIGLFDPQVRSTQLSLCGEPIDPIVAVDGTARQKQFVGPSLNLFDNSRTVRNIH
jgi:hypothetical protein